MSQPRNYSCGRSGPQVIWAEEEKQVHREREIKAAFLRHCAAVYARLPTHEQNLVLLGEGWGHPQVPSYFEFRRTYVGHHSE